MSISSWVVIWGLLAVGIGAAVYADKGSWINAVVTGQCNVCPAPPQCSGPKSRFGGSRFGGPWTIDGCNRASKQHA